MQRKLAVGTYRPSQAFLSIREHTAVCFDDDEMLVAVTGPAGDGESQEYAELFAAAPEQNAALARLSEIAWSMLVAKANGGPNQSHWAELQGAVQQAQAALVKTA